MAARNVSPGPAEPRPANRPRQQRKPEYPSVTAVNYRKTEKDVAKLIDCLAEWKQDLRAARSAGPDVPPPEESSPLRRPKSGLDRVTDAALPPGESPHRLDGIHGSRRGGLVGVHREHTTSSGETAGECQRSTGPAPPLRLRNRVAIHVHRACGLAVPGGGPTPIPLGPGPARFASGRGKQLAGATPFQPAVSGGRVVRSGRRIGSWCDRGLGPTLACGAP